MTYEGWANYHTWNVALWISNDVFLYNRARAFVNNMPADAKTDGLYLQFIANIPSEWGDLTPDGVMWKDVGLDYDALDQFIHGHSDFVEG